VAAILPPLRRRAFADLPRAPAQILGGLDTLPVELPFQARTKRSGGGAARVAASAGRTMLSGGGFPAAVRQRGARALPSAASLRLHGEGSSAAGGAGDGRWRRRGEKRREEIGQRGEERGEMGLTCGSAATW
jgi:hypothetical protein